MYPHERSLVQKMHGKPFVLLGVNSDQNAALAKQAVITEKLTWRSWLAGPGGGEIARNYQVSGWPTLFLIDSKGVIREKWLGAGHLEQIDEAVEKLVKAAREDQSREVASKPRQPAEPPRPAVDKPAAADPEREAGIKLKFAEQLAEDGLTDKAKERCRGIIKDFPKTKAAQKAQDLLDKLSR